MVHNFQTNSRLNFHWTFVSWQSKRCLIWAKFTCPECKSPPMLRPLDFVFPVPAPGLRVNTALFMKRRERMFLFIFYDADQIQCRIFSNFFIVAHRKYQLKAWKMMSIKSVSGSVRCDSQLLISQLNWFVFDYSYMEGNLLTAKVAKLMSKLQWTLGILW